MGVGCFNSQLNLNYGKATDIKIENDDISNFDHKIIIIQRRIKKFLNKIKFRKKIKLRLEKLSEELENIKLLNIDVITNSKPYKYYQEFLKKGLFKPYSEYLNNQKNLEKKLKIISQFTLDLPYFIVISQKLAYKGHINLDKKYHGYGILYQFNNIAKKERLIEGIFYNGVLSEYGRIVLSNGEMLRGDFNKNKLNGRGEYRRKDESIYTGIFFDGYPQGSGRETFKDGSFFEGFYIKGKKKHGTFEWKNKNKYEGFFENDAFHGRGTYQWSNKKRYDGEWKFGKMSGKGKLTYADGSYYIGDFEDGMKCGKGKYFWKHDNYYNGEWKNDVQNGYGTYYKNGQKIRGIWENGKLKNNEGINSINSSKSKRIFSIDKIKLNHGEIQKRYTFTFNNMDMMTKLSGEKISDLKISKENKNKGEEKEINLEKSKDNDNIRYSIKSGFNSINSINSLIKKEDK